jgi:outer membrane protease
VNHFLRRAFFTVFLASLLFSGNAAAQTAQKRGFSYSFSAELLLGRINGMGLELVYGSYGGSEYLSRLDWETTELYYYGTTLSFTLNTPLAFLSPFVRATAKTGVYGSTGYMEDRDWLDDDEPFLTSFSQHDNSTASAFFVDGDIGLLFRPWKSPAAPEFNLFFRAAWIKITWKSHGGYTQYVIAGNPVGFPYPQPWAPTLPKTDWTGPAINYSQDWLILAPGIGVEFPFFKFFSLNAAVTISPFILAANVDEHLGTGVVFNDYPRGGFYIKPELHFAFSPAEWVSFMLHGSWTLITGSTGESYSSTAGAPVVPAGIIGAGWDAWDIGIGIRIKT